MEEKKIYTINMPINTEIQLLCKVKSRGSNNKIYMAPITEEQEVLIRKNCEINIDVNNQDKDNIGKIPEGTILPLTVDRCLNAKKVKEGQVFIARTPFNFVTREKYILIPVGVKMDGQVIKVRRPT